MVIWFNTTTRCLLKVYNTFKFGNEHVNVGNEPFNNYSVRSIAYMTESKANIQKAYRQCLKEKNNHEYLALEKERTHVEHLAQNK